MFGSFRGAAAEARKHGDLYFAALLPEELIREAFASTRGLLLGWVYSPATTVWVFLSQCLSMDHSCRDAVARLLAWRVNRGLRPCSAETGAYCIARDQLPEEGCRQLVLRTGNELEQEVPESWLWQGRRVRVVDGSTITMPDTAKNQAEYPQLESQKPGCGFPIARIVVVFSLAVGTVVEAAIGKYEGKGTGENSMFRRLHDSLSSGDVVLADRYFGNWWDIALLQRRGVDAVMRKHQLRATDFRTGTKLGNDDHLVRWSKPSRPKWMSREEYAALPDELVLRELRVRVTQRGFRTRCVLVVTTLLDAQKITSVQLADLYRRRWQAELNLRSLKTVLQMEHLRCKTPHRVRNEFHLHLLGYNLIRKVMCEAALRSGQCPWQISFKGTLQTMSQFLPLLGCAPSLNAWYDALLDAIATHVVDNRPDRYEPRRTKRRPKAFKHFRESRATYKRRMAARR